SRASRLRAASTLQQGLHTGLWLEFGTVFARTFPFFFDSARLEEGAHEARMLRALQDAINETR
ncbi:MAG TPA: hypothetical protein VMW52_09570, partial [Phycisphaerae bacterium]|nr:hypothetical protein [Phycisphaerae bacterium]